MRIGIKCSIFPRASKISCNGHHFQDLSDQENYRLKAKVDNAIIGTNVKIVDELGDEVSHDSISIGEVIVRDNIGMKGY
ncbi:hypothetical protein [Lysinibacillus sp. C5.1]|uniref:hypothetical protein n=1 Tax=Lysinibacillus sp. C5.1 TaxID=2796169 RepID=UPI0030817182